MKDKFFEPIVKAIIGNMGLADKLEVMEILVKAIKKDLENPSSKL